MTVAFGLVAAHEKAVVPPVVVCNAARTGRAFRVLRTIGEAAVPALEFEALLPDFGALGVVGARGAHSTTFGFAAIVVTTAGRKESEYERTTP